MSAGTTNDAENPLTVELVEWAEIIFVLERAHRKKLLSKFKRSLTSQRVICLDIPDEYEYMDEELVELIRSGVEYHIKLLSNEQE